MSFPLGTKVRLVRPWRAYSAGTVLEQGFVADLQQLVTAGMAVEVSAEAEAPSRPAKLARAAAKKLADSTKNLFGKDSA